eukprot:TRINITY_DN83192_c0_g1_i1.p1 TRINITY_DN83192_c0_g1~~TRINITY_DN83192_c0_g1_i1.p1  ORF type:complete len:207 (+),score=22.98 TRINITY_DN83192_c0_g1_i1:59-622(+)
MAVCVSLLSGQIVDANFQEASRVEDIRDCVASKLLCPRKHIRLMAGDLLLEDKAELCTLPSTTMTAVLLGEQLDLSKLELTDDWTPIPQTSGCPIGCKRISLTGFCNHTNGTLHRSELLYDGKVLWEYHSCRCEAQVGASGRDHTILLSESKCTLNLHRTVFLGVDLKQLPAVALNVVDLMKKAALL